MKSTLFLTATLSAGMLLATPVWAKSGRPSSGSHHSSGEPSSHYSSNHQDHGRTHDRCDRNHGCSDSSWGDTSDCPPKNTIHPIINPNPGGNGFVNTIHPIINKNPSGSGFVNTIHPIVNKNPSAPGFNNTIHPIINPNPKGPGLVNTIHPIPGRAAPSGQIPDIGTGLDGFTGALENLF